MDSRHEPTSTQSAIESSSSSSPDDDRFRGVWAIVLEALTCSSRDRPPHDEILRIVNSWARILANVPTEYLGDSYIRAMRQRSMPGMLTPNEVHAAWIEIRAEERRHIVEAEGQKYLGPVPARSDGARHFAAGLEAARRMRGISTPAGELCDEADVQAAIRAIAPMQDHGERERLEEMRKQPADVREQYRRPGRDTLEKLTGVRPR